MVILLGAKAKTRKSNGAASKSAAKKSADKQAKTNKQTKTGKQAKKEKNANSQLLTKLAGGALAVTIILGVIVYTVLVVISPWKVSNAIAHITHEDVAVYMNDVVADALAKKSFTLLIDGQEEEFVLGDYEFTYSAYDDGHSETVEYVDSDGETQTKVITTVGNLCFNETAVRNFIYEIAAEHGTPMVEPYYEIDGETLTIYDGTDGVGIDFDDLISTVYERICSNDYSQITTQIETLVASEVDIDEIYESVKCDAADAYVTEDADGNPTFTEEVIGKDFDLEEARTIVSTAADSWEITLSLTYPNVDLTEVRAPYCLDELSSCTTSYSGSTAARANNVEQAADNINTYGDFTDGYVLQPGEEFSFNTVVGERTEENGFQKAPVYLSSGTAEDYGGGICQVSTTLYCAALYANLEITSRHNHMYVIHYWPTAGCDATVDWTNSIDFKFKNNKDYPIKITCSYENKKLTVTITGTEDGITAEMTSEVVETTAYSTVYKKPTSEYPEGTTTGGDNGKVIKVWRTVYDNGEFVSKTLESTNTYSPLNKVIYTNNLPDGAEYS